VYAGCTGVAYICIFAYLHVQTFLLALTNAITF
jgi:hypothetical protein